MSDEWTLTYEDVSTDDPIINGRRWRNALEQIANVANSEIRCVRHGGDFGADDPDTCGCGVSMDAGDKARRIAREALDGPPDAR